MFLQQPAASCNNNHNIYVAPVVLQGPIHILRTQRERFMIFAMLRWMHSHSSIYNSILTKNNYNRPIAFLKLSS